jgi:hypothetical protein
MPDPLLTPSSIAASAREVDAQCRGIGEPPHAAGAPVGTSGAARASIAGDVPVERPVVRDAVRLAVADAVTRQAHECVAGLWGLRAAGDTATAAELVEAPSPELVRLLGHLRSAVTRYVRERREAGAAVERVVPEVKCLVREAASCEGWVDPGDTLTAQAVRWAIEGYYDQPEQAHGPRFF